MRKIVAHGLVGKWRKEDNSGYPLIFHSVDAAAVALGIWRVAFGPYARERIAQALRCDENTSQRLLSFWVALHDLGKASPAFQVKDKTGATREKLECAGFEFPPYLTQNNTTFHNLVTADRLPEVLTAENYRYPTDFARNLAAALGGHHGSFPQPYELNNLPPGEVGVDLWEEARLGFVTELSRFLGVEELDWSPPENLAAGKAFILVLAGAGGKRCRPGFYYGPIRYDNSCH